MLGNAGKGVDVYVIDSGIRISNEGFGGRASNFDDLAVSDLTPYIFDSADETIVRLNLRLERE